MKAIEYEEIRSLNRSGKSTVLLVREKAGEQLYIRKLLNGQHSVYETLQGCSHPYLPKIYEVSFSENETSVIEEYIEGETLGTSELTERSVFAAIKELCSVLGFLHEKGVIHRDIKPSNIILAEDGHIRLIDFDAARMPKDDLEQDTRLLGTRGYAPPEQYGFAQTDERTDIYSLGVTIKQLLGEKANKPRYKRIIQKCTNLSPDKRYQSAQQVKRDLGYRKQSVLCGFILLFLFSIIWYAAPFQPEQPMLQEEQSANVIPVILPAPDNPHWNGETGIAVWGNVPDSGVSGEVRYHWRLYRANTASPPDVNESVWELDGQMGGNGGMDDNFPTYEMSLASALEENGFYYFAVAAAGDGINFSDSLYALSDAFEYTGESAPPLPTPTGLAWKTVEDTLGRAHYATWSNLDDYADMDSFNVRVYNQSGVMITNNIWTKEDILSLGHGGIWFPSESLTEEGGAYRFTVQAQTSRPNEYKSNPMPDPAKEDSYSSWYFPRDNYE